ncbi:hypothetical protein [Gordonia hankookensis]|uniref:Uncharacterized protein n=1 Tax=Gordonia hankookensis TaxID=589403 RepID=A0ABR7W6I8_9ACTN|nr:hypothetical protein [Gordonia hankookensis]MBD1318091.1 hypothetical protein [Gordonia hankookensis]
MLTLALAATLVGFVLLVLGLITGTVWLAIACIVVCLVGLGLLIADIVGSGRRNEEPTISDFVAADDDSLSEVNEDVGGRHEGASETRTRPAPTESRSGVATDAPQRAADDVGDARSAPQPSQPNQGEAAPRAGREGTYDDYLRSVGGFGADPGVTAPRPADQAPPTSPRGAGSYERQFPPPGRGAPGSHAAPDDPATESFPPQQRRPSPGGAQQRPPGQRSEERNHDRPREQRPQKFDPLDPNWRPPPE